MKVTKTIELSDEERKIVEKALGLIDEMSESANNTKTKYCTCKDR